MLQVLLTSPASSTTPSKERKSVSCNYKILYLRFKDSAGYMSGFLVLIVCGDHEKISQGIS